MKRFLLIILMIFISAHPCLAGVSAKKEVKKGNLLYNKGEFEEALKEYQAALQGAPDSDIVNFNLGAALYKTKDYKTAVSHFQKSLLSEDESLEQKASYNIGNAKYKFGITKEESDLQGAVDLLRQSLHHYERAIEINPEDEDARYNYEFVKKELERLEEKLDKQEQEAQAREEEEDEVEEPETQQAQAQQQEEKEQESSLEKESGEKQDEGQEQTQGIEPQTQQGEEEKQAQQAEKEGESDGEMSEKEALMILEGYRQEEEPKRLYREKIETRSMPEVLKDW